MASKVGAVINLVQEIVALDFKREKPTIRQLLIPLQIRETQVVSEAIAQLKILSAEISADQRYNAARFILSKETEILALFQELTTEEAKTLENYFLSVISKDPNSLASFLAKKLGAEIQDRYNLDNFPDPRAKEFIVKMAFRNTDYQEDFQLKIKSPTANQSVFDLIKEFYFGKGYQLGSAKIDRDMGLMLKKDKEFLFIVTTQVADILMVTVTAD